MDTLGKRIDRAIVEKLNEVFEGLEREDLRAQVEPEATIETAPWDDGDRQLIRNRIPDITIVKEIRRIPHIVDEIDDLDKWFPGVSPEVPLAQISVDTPAHAHPGYDTQHGVQLPAETQFDKFQYPFEYHIIESDEPDITDKIDFTDDLQLITTEEYSLEWFFDVFLKEMYGDIKDVEDDDLLGLYTVQPYIELWEDRIFHFDQVLRAYRQNQTGLLIVLLAVYFESHYYASIEEHLETLCENPAAGSISNDLNFKQTLDYCRYFGVIDDSEYGIVDKIRDARNDYAHEIGAFRSDRSTSIEQEGLVEGAIELYENMIGVESSMITSE